MKRLLSVLIAALAAATGAVAQFSTVTDIDDLALIYIGNRHRPDWNKEMLRPYVEHRFADGSRSWMFDGFLMLEFMAHNDSNIQVSLGEYNGRPACRADWERLIDTQLGLHTGNGCRALDELIGELIPELGTPGHRHKMVFSLPLPVAGFKDWGEIDGEKMDFSLPAHRVKSMKWYAGELTRKWREAGFRNLDLDGVYWIKESFDPTTIEIAAPSNAAFHDMGLKVYWIPYFFARGKDNWRDYGIDVAYLQPNYYMKPEATIGKLNDAIDYAKGHGTGLEVEFAGYSYYRDFKTGELVRTQHADMGLHAESPEVHQRFVDYLDRFEQESVFDTMPVAYYTGFSGVFDFVNSVNEIDRLLLDRLAAIINRRHAATGWVKEESK